MSAEKESTGNINVEKCAVILLDVAGTTTSNSFVKDTLFPFAVSNAEEYLKSQWNEDVVKDAVKQLEDSENVSVSEVVEIVKTATEKDEVNKGVKILQGLIYRQGYEDGKLKAHVFPDVSSSLESWVKNHRVAIYSSGSIESQKLLFAHTTEGDLSANIAQYFDLSVGPKVEVSSYENIIKELAVAPEEIIYINDDVEEAKAASQAGIRSILIIREGNAEIPEEKLKEFKVIKSFAELSMEVSAKRKIEEEETPEEPPTKVAKTEEPEAVESKADEEKKNVVAEEEPMEIDSTNEIKDDKAGEPATNKDENIMEVDVNTKNEKTESETELKEEVLNEAIQKGDGELKVLEKTGDDKVTNNEQDANATESAENKTHTIDAESKISNTEAEQGSEVNADTSTEGKSVAEAESRQANSDSAEKSVDSSQSEKFEGFSKSNTDSNKVQADSTEKLADVGDKTATDSALVETVKDDTSIVSKVEEKTANDDACVIESKSETIIDKSSKECESSMKDVAEEKITENIKNDEMDVTETECKSSEVEKEIEENKSEKAKDLPSIKPEIQVQLSEADEAGNKETKPEPVEVDPLKTEDTKTPNDKTEEASMEICETTVEDKVEGNTNNVEDTHKECKENSDSSTAESVHINNEKIDSTVTQGDDVDSSTANTEAETIECSSSEVRNVCEKKVEEETKSAVEIPTEKKDAVDCEADGTGDKVNGNEAESSKSDEKENKSELANGTPSVETGSDVNENGDVENATEEEIKVKKLEENPDSTAVSVEA